MEQYDQIILNLKQTILDYQENLEVLKQRFKEIETITNELDKLKQKVQSSVYSSDALFMKISETEAQNALLEKKLRSISNEYEVALNSIKSYHETWDTELRRTIMAIESEMGALRVEYNAKLNNALSLIKDQAYNDAVNLESLISGMSETQSQLFAESAKHSAEGLVITETTIFKTASDIQKSISEAILQTENVLSCSLKELNTKAVLQIDSINKGLSDLLMNKAHEIMLELSNMKQIQFTNQSESVSILEAESHRLSKQISDSELNLDQRIKQAVLQIDSLNKGLSDLLMNKAHELMLELSNMKQMQFTNQSESVSILEAESHRLSKQISDSELKLDQRIKQSEHNSTQKIEMLIATNNDQSKRIRVICYIGFIVLGLLISGFGLAFQMGW